MKSRELFTTPVLIVSNYKIVPAAKGKYRHTFTPESTNTLYEFEANAQPELIQGERYNIGYTVEDGRNIVDMAATAMAANVDPAISYYVSTQLGSQNAPINIGKSVSRVVHAAKDGRYLGKKYAWRVYGMAVARGTFDQYMEDVGHPQVPCLTDGSPSIAYKDHGIDVAMKNLFDSLVHKGGNRYSSHLLPSKKWFLVKGIDAITEKK